MNTANNLRKGEEIRNRQYETAKESARPNSRSEQTKKNREQSAQEEENGADP